jgi:hypothetical protein
MRILLCSVMAVLVAIPAVNFDRRRTFVAHRVTTAMRPKRAPAPGLEHYNNKANIIFINNRCCCCSSSCPSNTYHSSAVRCRDAAGPCDVYDFERVVVAAAVFTIVIVVPSIVLEAVLRVLPTRLHPVAQHVEPLLAHVTFQNRFECFGIFFVCRS